MELMEAIKTRRSVRDYTEKPVSKETIRLLLEAAAQAPSAMNSQPWAFAVIQGAVTLKELSDSAKTCLLAGLTPDSPLARYRETLEDKGYNIFYNATTLVLILAKPAGPCPVEDCQLAAENLMLAARAQGLGTCYMGFGGIYLNTPAGKQAYGIPENYKVAAAIIVGTPKEELSAPEKNALEIVFWKED